MKKFIALGLFAFGTFAFANTEKSSINNLTTATAINNYDDMYTCRIDVYDSHDGTVHIEIETCW
ncbi:hypothetical protein GCM10022393_32330 [Aquimarina addita]|uniref:Uncharacterized protein n=1 Tax=Aquimarina addita TaxID=870485 RepID=A0ABP6UT19_9FLAO